MGYYSHPHTATDFTTMKVNPDLAVLGNCYPGDFDGFVSRRGVMGHPIRFLLIDTKHGERLPDGQKETFQGLAALPDHPIRVLIVTNRWSEPIDGRRPFDPESFFEVLPNGTFGPTIQTNLMDFSKRYEIWYRTFAGSLTAFNLNPVA